MADSEKRTKKKSTKKKKATTKAPRPPAPPKAPETVAAVATVSVAMRPAASAAVTEAQGQPCATALSLEDLPKDLQREPEDFADAVMLIHQRALKSGRRSGLKQAQRSAKLNYKALWEKAGKPKT